MTAIRFDSALRMVSRGLVLSSALLAGAWLAASSTTAIAHEVQPSVADLTISGDRLTLEVESTIEPFIAGADLDGLADTDASAAAAEVDRLRALPPARLEAIFRDHFPDLADRIEVRSGGAPLPLQLREVRIPEVGDPDLARLSEFVVTAELPAGDAPVTIGWSAGLGALVLRQMSDGPSPYTGYLQDGATSDPIPRTGGSAQGVLSAFLDYVPVGFTHIVPKGLDHILFVLGLFFLSAQMRPLLWQITAFTAAHTVTLALASLGVVSVPAGVVEPLIAASIVYVGVENVLTRRMSPWRPLVVLLFGLLHGLGFASVLTEFGLGHDNFVGKLIGFNVGVELGQIFVIAVAFALIGYWVGSRPWYKPCIANPASIAIAVVGAVWFVQRTAF